MTSQICNKNQVSCYPIIVGSFELRTFSNWSWSHSKTRLLINNVTTRKQMKQMKYCRFSMNHALKLKLALKEGRTHVTVYNHELLLVGWKEVGQTNGLTYDTRRVALRYKGLIDLIFLSFKIHYFRLRHMLSNCNKKKKNFESHSKMVLVPPK